MYKGSRRGQTVEKETDALKEDQEKRNERQVEDWREAV